jgi:EAL domain-containing protein (putative c-di-GMP-specific phosphodiesterase class I)
LERDELTVYYQPILDAESGSLVGAEALVRWRHPQRGLVLPNDFIPLAEETGLIRKVGAWVLERVCQTIGHWRRIGLCVPISVNLSSVQILRGLSVEAVRALIQRYDLRPEWLAFEITESVLISNTLQAQQWLEAVRELGIRVDIDDFGTGYSSLTYLKRFPIDRIKIDYSFVRDIVVNSNDRALVEAILAMACSLRLQVVAEGVEDAEQLALLRRLGCKYAQGFYFSRPVPDEEFVKFAGELGAIRA